MFRTKKVRVDCLDYCVGDAILISEDEINGPSFGYIEDILCSELGKFLVLRHMETVEFDKMSNAYHVRLKEEVNPIVKKVSSFQNKWPLQIYKDYSGQKLLVVNRASVMVQEY